jgi:hypothetical protein
LLLDISQISKISLISIVEGVLKKQQRAAGSVGCGVKKKTQGRKKRRNTGWVNIVFLVESISTIGK